VSVSQKLGILDTENGPNTTAPPPPNKLPTPKSQTYEPNGDDVKRSSDGSHSRLRQRHQPILEREETRDRPPSSVTTEPPTPRFEKNLITTIMEWLGGSSGEEIALAVEQCNEDELCLLLPSLVSLLPTLPPFIALEAVSVLQQRVWDSICVGQAASFLKAVAEGGSLPEERRASFSNPFNLKFGVKEEVSGHMLGGRKAATLPEGWQTHKMYATVMPNQSERWGILSEVQVPVDGFRWLKEVRRRLQTGDLDADDIVHPKGVVCHPFTLQRSGGLSISAFNPRRCENNQFEGWGILTVDCELHPIAPRQRGGRVFQIVNLVEAGTMDTLKATLTSEEKLRRLYGDSYPNFKPPSPSPPPPSTPPPHISKARRGSLDNSGGYGISNSHGSGNGSASVSASVSKSTSKSRDGERRRVRGGAWDGAGARVGAGVGGNRSSVYLGKIKTSPERLLHILGGVSSFLKSRNLKLDASPTTTKRKSKKGIALREWFTVHGISEQEQKDLLTSLGHANKTDVDRRMPIRLLYSRRGEPLRLERLIALRPLSEVANSTWKAKGLCYHSKPITANVAHACMVLPGFGCIEYFPDSTPLSRWNESYGFSTTSNNPNPRHIPGEGGMRVNTGVPTPPAWSEDDADRFMASAVGTCALCWVLGVRCSEDNLLIIPNSSNSKPSMVWGGAGEGLIIRSDGNLVLERADFILGENDSGNHSGTQDGTPNGRQSPFLREGEGLGGGRFLIPPALPRLLGGLWGAFVVKLTHAILALRKSPGFRALAAVSLSPLVSSGVSENLEDVEEAVERKVQENSKGLLNFLGKMPSTPSETKQFRAPHTSPTSENSWGPLAPGSFASPVHNFTIARCTHSRTHSIESDNKRSIAILEGKKLNSSLKPVFDLKAYHEGILKGAYGAKGLWAYNFLSRSMFDGVRAPNLGNRLANALKASMKVRVRAQKRLSIFDCVFERISYLTHEAKMNAPTPPKTPIPNRVNGIYQTLPRENSVPGARTRTQQAMSLPVRPQSDPYIIDRKYRDLHSPTAPTSPSGADRGGRGGRYSEGGREESIVRALWTSPITDIVVEVPLLRSCMDLWPPGIQQRMHTALLARLEEEPSLEQGLHFLDLSSRDPQDFKVRRRRRSSTLSLKSRQPKSFQSLTSLPKLGKKGSSFDEKQRRSRSTSLSRILDDDNQIVAQSSKSRRKTPPPFYTVDENAPSPRGGNLSPRSPKKSRQNIFSPNDGAHVDYHVGFSDIGIFDRLIRWARKGDKFGPEPTIMPLPLNSTPPKKNYAEPDNKSEKRRGKGRDEEPTSPRKSHSKARKRGRKRCSSIPGIKEMTATEMQNKLQPRYVLDEDLQEELNESRRSPTARLFGSVRKIKLISPASKPDNQWDEQRESDSADSEVVRERAIKKATDALLNPSPRASSSKKTDFRDIPGGYATMPRCASPRARGMRSSENANSKMKGYPFSPHDAPDGIFGFEDTKPTFSTSITTSRVAGHIWLMGLAGSTAKRKGFRMSTKARERVYHPFLPGYRITNLTVRKVFKSKLKPALISVIGRWEKRPSIQQKMRDNSFIFKTGDDLRLDWAVLASFRFFNRVWENAGLYFQGIPIHAHVFKVIPTHHKQGIIEFVQGTVPLVDVDKLSSSFKHGAIDRLIATAVGAYISSFVLGIRDRHHDNILVNPDGAILHVDFAFMLGERPTIDTSRFAITKKLYQGMGLYWNHFVDLCIESYRALVQNQHQVIAFILKAFRGLKDPTKIATHVRQSLMLDLDLDIACAKLRTMIEKAPTSYNTRLKNFVHAIAVSAKG